ncbi:DGQHR domain-containing protein [Planomicrobium stackebrandtii]|uniref:DGQHR domain-containing protein n=1 Tax=Planomicrobium stackebrandtii TaxID=253160 RepID=A0ABU0GVM6_9BACL|nr:DGQHR domain-containing protein [Planomicrobium stackebrandtii]MDQ0429419.1 DGQHR domain-containing protein [Planomicrobium stackebrandtii]
MSKSYSKKKDELISLIMKIKERSGKSFKIRLIKLNQQNEYAMYFSALPVDASFVIARRIPKDYDNPKGIQRALKESKITEISSKSMDISKFSSPNAVVMNLITNRDGKHPNLSGIVSFEESIMEKNVAVYSIDLDKYEKKLKSLPIDQDGYLEGNSEEILFPGVLIDAHHRTEGLYSAGRMDFELPLTVYLDLPEKEMARIFIDINEKQEKPSQVHTLAMKSIAGVLAGDEEVASNIIDGLDKNESSILYQRIKTVDGKRPKEMKKTYVTNSTFSKLLKNFILPHLGKKMSLNRQIDLINDYFTAWSEVFPEAWSDEKNHVLVKSLGFQIMMRLFSTIHNLVTVSDGVPSVQDYKKIISKTLKKNNILEIDENQSFPINWKSEVYGGYSSGKGINAISTSLTQHIADHK